MVRIDRIEPYKNFNFHVKLGDGTIGGFQEMSAIEKLTGLNKSTDVTLKRGVIAAPALQDWLKQVKKKRTITVELQSETHTITARWVLHGARLVKHNVDPMNATGNEVVIETLALSADRLEFLSPAS
jgi:phage tail-like protein